MAIQATTRTVAETYDRIRGRLAMIKADATGHAAALGSAMPVGRVMRLVEYYRPALTDLPASGNFPQAWIDALAAWANTQNPAAQRTAAQWVSEYDAAGNAIRALFAALVAAVPKDADGKVLQYTLNADGSTTEASVPAESLTTARTAAQAVDSAIA